MPSIQNVIDCFEDCWQSPTKPNIVRFVQELGDDGLSANRRLLIEELVKVDLEYRWKASLGQKELPATASTVAAYSSTCESNQGAAFVPDLPRLDDYVRCLPDLGSADDLALELVLEEYRVRRRWGDKPSRDEYRSRFPKHGHVLCDALAEMDQQLEYELRATEETGNAPVPRIFAKPSRSKAKSGEKYELKQVFAEGGLGRVWLAEDTVLRRNVALKEIRRGRAAAEESRRRLINEAQITGQLQHPNIVPVYELTQDEEDRVFYTMRLVQGQTLDEAIPARRTGSAGSQISSLELARLLRAFVSICHAITYAHSRRIVHRDVKPNNVVLGDFGEVIVLDWGLAKQLGDSREGALSADGDGAQTSDSQTVDGTVLGSPLYMAPEQAAGKIDETGFHTDVYGLGAILFQILTGCPPHQGENRQQLLASIVDADSPEPRTVDPRVPGPLNAICRKAMSKDPLARYDSARELAEDVERWLADEPVSVYRESVIQKVGRWMRRHRAWTQAGAIALLLVAIVSVLAAVVVNEFRRHADEQRGIADTQRREAARQRAVAKRQLADHLWNSAVAHRDAYGNRLASAHYFALAAAEFEKQPERAKDARFAAHMLSRDLQLRNIIEHDDDVWRAEFIADGKRIVSASRNGAMRLTDTTNGSTLARIDPGDAAPPEFQVFNPAIGEWMKYEDYPGGILFNQDKTKLLTWASDGVVRVLSLDTGKVLGAFDHKYRVLGAAFSRNEHEVLSWDRDGVVRLWNVATGKVVAHAKHSAGIAIATLQEPERRIWSMSTDGRIHVLEVRSGDEQEIYNYKYESTNQEQITVDGAILGKQGDARILAWNSDDSVWVTEYGQLISELKHDAKIRGVMFNEQENRVLSWSADGVVRFWEAESGNDVIAPIQHHHSRIPPALSEGEYRILTCSEAEGAIRLNSTDTGELINQFHHDRVTGARWIRRGTQILSGSRDGSLRVWDVETGKVLVRVQHDGAVIGAILSSDGGRALSWSQSGSVKVWDADTGFVVAEMQHGDVLRGATFTKDNRQILTWSKDGSARLWDITLNETVARKEELIGGVLGAGGRNLLTWSGDGSIELRDGKTGSTRRQTQHSGVEGAVLSADEKRVLSWSNDGTVQLWHPDSDIVREFKHGERYTQATFSPDEDRILSWSTDGWVRVWSAASGELITELNHGDSVRDAVFGHDGFHVLSLRRDGEIWLWEANEVSPRSTVKQHAATGFRVSRDRHRVFSWSGGFAQLWDLETGDVLAELETSEIVTDAEFASSGPRVLVGLERQLLLVYDTVQAEVVARLPHEDRIQGAVFSADIGRVLTWSRDGTTRFWEVDSSKIISEVSHGSSAKSARFFENAERVLSWGKKGNHWSARIWNAESGDLLAEFDCEHPINIVALSDDETSMVMFSPAGENAQMRMVTLPTENGLPMSAVRLMLEVQTGTTLDVDRARVVRALSKKQWDARKRELEAMRADGT